MLFARIAWRNIWRNRRRTILTIGAIAFAVFVCVFVVAMGDGTHWAMIRNMLELQSGYLQIQKAPNPKLEMEEIRDWPSFAGALIEPRTPGAAAMVGLMPENLKNVLGRAVKNNGGRLEYEKKIRLLAWINRLMEGNELDTERAEESGGAAGPDSDGQNVVSRRLRNRRFLERAFPRSIPPLEKKNYRNDPLVEKCFDFGPELKKLLRKAPHITAYAPRLETGALVAGKDNSMGALVIGVSPGAEQKVSSLARKIVKGTFIGHERRQCVVGSGLAEYLSIGPGDGLVVMAQAVDGSTGAMKFTVCGVMNCGADALDKNVILVPIEDLGFVLRAEGKAHVVACKLDDPWSVDRVESRLQAELAGRGLCALGWPKLVPEVISIIELDDLFGNIFLGIVLLVVVTGILSTVLASVLERTREFGIMLALGTRPLQIVSMILFETVLLTGLGLAIGGVAGLGTTAWFVHHPIDLPLSSEQAMASYNCENKLFFEIRPLKISIIVMSLLGLAVLFALLPAWRASRLAPDRAMRTVDV